MNVWPINPPSRDELVSALTNVSTPVFLTFSWEFYRRNVLANVARGESRQLLPIETRLEMAGMSEGQGGSVASEATHGCQSDNSFAEWYSNTSIKYHWCPSEWSFPQVYSCIWQRSHIQLGIWTSHNGRLRAALSRIAVCKWCQRVGDKFNG